MTLEDFRRIRNFPYLKDFKGKGFRIPVYKEEKNIRIYPYGRMAYRSIGRVNESFETGEFHGYSDWRRASTPFSMESRGKQRKWR